MPAANERRKMEAWGVWVWTIGETQRDGHWYEDRRGVPYVFYHAGAALATADAVVVMDHTLISAICEFDATGLPLLHEEVEEVADVNTQ